MIILIIIFVWLTDKFREKNYWIYIHIYNIIRLVRLHAYWAWIVLIPFLLFEPSCDATQRAQYNTSIGTIHIYTTQYSFLFIQYILSSRTSFILIIFTARKSNPSISTSFLPPLLPPSLFFSESNQNSSTKNYEKQSRIFPSYSIDNIYNNRTNYPTG